jgi:agmatine deiminase
VSTRLPPEWAPQRAVLLTWPHDAGDWGDALPAVEAEYAAFAAAIAAREGLIVACRDAAHRDHVAARLKRAGVAPERLALHLAPSNDVWARDHGPITVLDDAGPPRALDFRFNGWGGKYRADLDDALTAALARDGAFDPAVHAPEPYVLEGGNLEVDGAGTLLTTRACLLAPSRNPPARHEALLGCLRERLGVGRVLFLADGEILGDDTDGHVDTLVRFCDARTLAYSAADTRDAQQHARLAPLAAQLAGLRTADDRPYRLVPLPLPRPLHDAQGRRLPATYANFLIVNGAVLVPVYDDPRDEVALARLRACFPDRAVIGLRARALTAQNGGLHCASMQIPAWSPPP